MTFGYEIKIIEIIGIIAFAISGAIVGIKKNFDLFGVLTLGVLTAVGGGMLRDIILGITPPYMFTNSLYVLIAFITSILTFLLIGILRKRDEKNIEFFHQTVNFFDAVGLGVFGVTGANTAILEGYLENAFFCIFLGVITGIGGGMLRDILSGKVPFVLYKDIYASASIIGVSIFYIFVIQGLDEFLGAFTAIFVTIIIRVWASSKHLRLPKLGDISLKHRKNQK